MDAITLKQKRIQLEATQKELAEALCVTPQTIINWGRGKYPVPFLAEHFIN